MRLFAALILPPLCAFAAGELSGRRAPGFALADHTARLHDLADYRGRAVILDFMQVTCPHCVTFSKILEQVKAKYGGKVAILSVVNPPSDMKGVTSYIANHKITSPILFDCGQVAYSYLLPKTGSVNVPHVFFIDAEGMIRNDVGYSDAAKDIFEGKGIFAEVEKLLAPKRRATEPRP